MPNHTAGGVCAYQEAVALGVRQGVQQLVVHPCVEQDTAALLRDVLLVEKRLELLDGLLGHPFAVARGLFDVCGDGLAERLHDLHPFGNPVVDDRLVDVLREFAARLACDAFALVVGQLHLLGMGDAHRVHGELVHLIDQIDVLAFGHVGGENRSVFLHVRSRPGIRNVHRLFVHELAVIDRAGRERVVGEQSFDDGLHPDFNL